MLINCFNYVELLLLLLPLDLLVDLVDGLGAGHVPPRPPVVLPQVDQVLQKN